MSAVFIPPTLLAIGLSLFRLALALKFKVAVCRNARLSFVVMVEMAESTAIKINPYF
jgi:hypothetical protein